MPDVVGILGKKDNTKHSSLCLKIDAQVMSSTYVVCNCTCLRLTTSTKSSCLQLNLGFWQWSTTLKDKCGAFPQTFQIKQIGHLFIKTEVFLVVKDLPFYKFCSHYVIDVVFHGKLHVGSGASQLELILQDLSILGLFHHIQNGFPSWIKQIQSLIEWLSSCKANMLEIMNHLILCRNEY